MPVGTIDFPELRNPGRVNPISEMLSSAVNAYYTPQERSAGVGLKQAEANSKNAYANFTAPQIAATLLSSPALRDTLDKNTIKNLTNFAGNSLNAGVNNMNNRQNQPSLIQHIMQGFGFGDNNISPQSPQNSSNAPIAPGEISSNNQVDNGNPNGERAPSHMPTSTIGNIAGDINNSGSAGGINPGAVGEAQEAGLKTTATAEAGAYADQWKTREDENKGRAENATKDIQDNLNVLDAFRKMSKYEKGSFAGTLINPVRNAIGLESSPHQVFTQYANTRATGISSGVSNGTITKEQAEIGRSMKVSDKSEDATVNHTIAFDNGVKARELQKIAFEQEAKNKGLSPSQADLLFYRYANEKPFWDNKNERILKNNFNYNHYFDKKMIDWAKNPDSVNYLPEYLRNETTTDDNSPYPNANSQPTPGQTYEKTHPEVRSEPLVKVKNSKGQTGTVPQSKLKDYLANGYSKI